MSNAKLGREPAFPVWTDDMPVEGTPGISKRFYAACAAMRLQPELISIELEDEDMIEDNGGHYIKSKFTNNYLLTSSNKKNKMTYSIKTTPEYRLVRQLYKIADEMLKQENL